MTGQRGQRSRMSSRCCRGSATHVLLCLLLLFSAVASTRQQGNAAAGGSWERFSRLIPATNSVYEQRDNVASLPAAKRSNADASLLRLLDENNVMDSPKAEAADRKDQDVLPKRSDEVGKGNNDVPPRNKPEAELPDDDRRSRVDVSAGIAPLIPDAADEEVYEDDYEEEEEESTLSKTQDYVAHGEQNLNETRETKDEETLTKDGYHGDLSTSHYDAYYYDDDYDNSNHTRYEAIADDAVDYPDPDFSEETSDPSAAKTVHNSDAKDVEHEESLPKSERITSSAAVANRSDEETSPSESEQGSSMESSNKSFLFSKPAPGVHYDEEEEEEEEEEGSQNDSVLIGEAVVSVVTTKSVVNGTISVPATTSSPEAAEKHTEQISAPPTTSSGAITSTSTDSSPTTTEHVKPTTEDSSRILASVQTSRSISGARFLPFPVVDRVESIDNDPAASGARKTATPAESTESIIDKLDRVQSELSSGFLAGGFRTAGNTLQLDVLNERPSTRRRFTTTAKTPVISKFVPRRYNDRRTDLASTTAKSTVQTLEGLLQRDFNSTGKSVATERPKLGFRWPSVKTTAPPETSETKTTSRPALTARNTKPNVVQPDISAFLPPGYKLKKEDATVTESSILSDILAKSKVDISSLLPSNYNLKKPEEMATTTAPASSATSSVLSDILTKSKVDLSSLLPPDYDKKKKDSVASASATNSSAGSNVEASTEKSLLQDIFAKSKVDIAALLPPDYKEKAKNSTAGAKSTPEMASTESLPSSTSDATTAKSAGGLKIVFPSRPGGRKPIHKITTPPSPRGDGPSAVTPRIQKGWPTRATTEFTGWPPNYTTQISIAKLVEVARTATDATANTSMIPTTSVVSSTTTTTTTTTTPRPTTPGTCEEECEVAGTIRIVGNATWLPELLDRNTHEWQQLASELEREMNFIFSKSAILRKWYKSIRIDSFSQGSILVDYFVELADLSQKVNTQELRVIFHDSLRMYNAHRWNDTKAKGTMRLGSFTIDTKFTDFVVIPKVSTPQYIERDDRLIPQWAIAVIVIGVGGLLFIIIFGVSVLVNRHHRSKLKPSMSTIYEDEVAKNMMHSNHGAPSHRSADYQKPASTIWNDPEVSWNDKSFESTSNKILVDRSFQDNKKYNMYDSWRSEWNGYYYNPSHASSKYAGYDSTTNLSSRHQPDYDTNF